MALKISNILDNLYVQKFYNTDMEEMQVRMVVNNPFDYAFLNDTKYNLRPGSKNTS
jgi:hypothetical protein